MGIITIPTTGTVYLDTDAIIYSVEKIVPYAGLLHPLWLAAQTGVISIITSELTLLETLVKPIRDKDNQLEMAFRSLLLASHEVRSLSISEAVLEVAARLRAEVGLKTPDAIHASTALTAGYIQFITNDQAYRRVSGLPVVILDEVIAAP